MSKPAKAKVDVTLAADQRADAGAVAVLRGLLAVIVEDLPGAIDGADPEYLHQLRIAVRRSRTVQRQLRHVFEPVTLAGFRAEFRWLQRATGDARDLDVYVSELDELAGLIPEGLRADLEPLRPVLAHARLAARAEMTAALRSERCTQLLSDWEQLLETLVEQPVDGRPAAGRSLRRVVAKRVRRVYRHVRDRGAAIDAASPATAYHDLRKQGKELRYLLELFALPLGDPDVVGPAIATLKQVQDVLGRHQDREVQIAMLRSVADEVATLPGGPAACMAMGVLVDRLAADERAARDEFAQRFEQLRGDEHREVFESMPVE